MTDSLPTIDPRHTALLVMDVQAMALSAISEAETLLARVADALAIVRDRDGHIGYVRVGFEDADYDAVPAYSMMAPVVAAGQAVHSESPATAVHDHVAPEPGDIIVRKTRVGAFSSTDLDAQLRDRKITTLILAGIITSGVVLSTFATHTTATIRSSSSLTPVPTPVLTCTTSLSRRSFPDRRTSLRSMNCPPCCQLDEFRDIQRRGSDGRSRLPRRGTSVSGRRN
jgi:isochorismate hydrolase